MLIIGNANVDETGSAIRDIQDSFDIIIDDGSHKSSDIIKSFARYFPLLVDEGIYIIDDLHCSYWKDYDGGLFDPYSAITFLKLLIDTVNYEHWGVSLKNTSVFNGFFQHYSFQMNIGTLEHIHSAKFLNSMCIIRKSTHEKNKLGTRVVVGTLDLVSPGKLADNSQEINVPDQTMNEWTNCIVSKGEEVAFFRERLGPEWGNEVSLTPNSFNGIGEFKKLQRNITRSFTNPTNSGT
ncbi:MAG: hypothetical protein ABSF43_01725 [Rectinemataceae bacterium]|jgi:hypothetical protein